MFHFQKNDKRALSLLVFHVLRRAVESFPEGGVPSDREIQNVLIDAISLLPGLGALSTERTGKVRLYRFPTGEELPKNKAIFAKEVSLDLQPVIDSLRIVWQDYQKHLLRKKPEPSPSALHGTFLHPTN